jgi:hypothetical protein
MHPALWEIIPKDKDKTTYLNVMIPSICMEGERARVRVRGNGMLLLQEDLIHHT